MDPRASPDLGVIADVAIREDLNAITEIHTIAYVAERAHVNILAVLGLRAYKAGLLNSFFSYCNSWLRSNNCVKAKRASVTRK